MPERTILIIRHAESMSNIGKYDHRNPDDAVPLSSRGIEQSKELGNRILARWRQNGNPLIYTFSSPYRRALETAMHSMEQFDVTEPHGPTIIPDLMEREIRSHRLCDAEIRTVEKMQPSEKFFYGSEHMEPAAHCASRLQRTIYDIRSWSRQPKFAGNDMLILVYTHSLLIEAWKYIEDINHHNEHALNFSEKRFPLGMEGYGEEPRVKNCEWVEINYQS